MLNRGGNIVQGWVVKREIHIVKIVSQYDSQGSKLQASKKMPQEAQPLRNVVLTGSK